MSSPFNISAVALFVVGGVAALALATVLALGGYGRPDHRAASAAFSASAASSAPPTASSQPETEVDYVPDEYDAPSAEPRTP